jgi:predicted nucleotidyltransferase
VEPTELLSRVERALLPIAGVQAAFLFGSRATGKARPDSDIDIAVLLDSAPASGEGKRVLWQLLTALGSELRSDRVDLVVLNEASPKLAFQVLKQGLLAFARDLVQLHRFRVRTYSLHADREPVERFFREVTKRRAQGG